MKVIDHEPHAWFLIQLGNEFFLDVLCEHNCFGYTYMIQLSNIEHEKYRNGGRAYIDKLAADIQYSAPVAKGSNSIYKDRDVSDKYSQESSLAIKAWRQKNENV